MACCGCAPEIGSKFAEQTDFGRVDCSATLGDTENLVGPPVITQLDGSQLTIDLVQIDVDAPKTVVFRMEGGTPGATHHLRFQCDTDRGSRTSGIVGEFRLRVCGGCCA